MHQVLQGAEVEAGEEPKIQSQFQEFVQMREKSYIHLTILIFFIELESTLVQIKRFFLLALTALVIA